jgi:hypothetical protein
VELLARKTMSRIVLDSDLKARLNGLNTPMELVDPDGRTVGHFLPADEYKKLLYAAVEAACPFPPEELERRRREKGGRPLADILKSLERQ